MKVRVMSRKFECREDIHLGLIMSIFTTLEFPTHNSDFHPLLISWFILTSKNPILLFFYQPDTQQTLTHLPATRPSPAVALVQGSHLRFQ